MADRCDCDWWDLNRPVLDVVDQLRPSRGTLLAGDVVAYEMNVPVGEIARRSGLDVDVVTWVLFDLHASHLIVTVDPAPVVRTRILTPANRVPEDHPLGGTIDAPASVEAVLTFLGVDRVPGESVRDHRVRRLRALIAWADGRELDPCSRVAGELRYLRVLPRLSRPLHPLPAVPAPATPAAFTAGDAIRLANVAGRDRTIRSRAKLSSTRPGTILRILSQADQTALPGPVGLLVAGVPARVVAELAGPSPTGGA